MSGYFPKPSYGKTYGIISISSLIISLPVAPTSTIIEADRKSFTQGILEFSGLYLIDSMPLAPNVTRKSLSVALFSCIVTSLAGIISPLPDSRVVPTIFITQLAEVTLAPPPLTTLKS